MSTNQMPCGCHPDTSCDECNPPTCIGCSEKKPLMDDMCEACTRTAAELDADLERAAAAHGHSATYAGESARAARSTRPTVRIPYEAVRERLDNQKEQS